MAIILKCSQCHEQLEVDDAFAGGICRCIHCGGLSHVPLQPTRTDRRGRPTTPPVMAQPLVTLPNEDDDLHIAPTREYVIVRKRRGLLAIIMMAMALALAAAAIWMAYELGLLAGPDEGPTDGKAGTRQTVNPFIEEKRPNFAGLELTGASVAYLLNAGSSMRDVFDAAGLAIELSVRSLADARFLAAPWPQSGFMGETAETPPAVFPADALASAADDEDRRKLKDWLKEISSSGRRNPARAVEIAVGRGVETILLITNRDLEADEAQAIRAGLTDKNVAARAVVIATGTPDEFKQLLGVVGGQANLLVISPEDLLLGVQEAIDY